MDQQEHNPDPGDSARVKAEKGFDRRAVLRRAAIAGAVSWTAPVILTSEFASAGVFTAKCAPGTVTATAIFVQTVCADTSSTITITITFAGPCPCGGTKLWCAQKNAPAPTIASTSATLAFSVLIPSFNVPVNISGKVALGCTDRDGDRQYAVYNWAMTALDNGSFCSVANSISAVTLSGRTIVSSVGCPTLAAAFAPATAPAIPTGQTRPTG